MRKTLFYPFLAVYVAILVYLAWSTPISPHEAKILYAEDGGMVTLLVQSGHDLLDGLIGLRLFSLVAGLLSIVLYHRMTGYYLTGEDDRRFATAVFMLLPGIITAFVLANHSVLVIPLVLLFVISHERGWLWVQALLMLCLLVLHEASIVFFGAVFIYAVAKKEVPMGVLSGFFIFLAVMIEQGVEVGGKPAGHFAEMFGLYAALFSPALFIYFFYTLYRIFLREEKDILWYISFIALIASFVLSLRQRIVLTDFAPYVMTGVVLALSLFIRTLRVRLPQYRKPYKIGLWAVMAILISSSLAIVLHRPLFLLLDDPKDHFAYRLYEPYWLAQKLHKSHIECYDTANQTMALQLRFYGIDACH
jgi:hypothetical protein